MTRVFRCIEPYYYVYEFKVMSILVLISYGQVFMVDEGMHMLPGNENFEHNRKFEEIK